jgi:hypothetical protein
MKMISKVKKLRARNTLKIFSSNFMCINMFITNADFIAAMPNATSIVYLPRLIPATVTVIDVNARSASQTKI